ncbi:cyclic peptide export ABC transporter [Chengkuizengella sp. SCS-71B]|uniref:cyclic peptide export ABC transporter n=1 Tax=Chengkuizengella sp. SCS-71B TaxID=3115290 RepID=UPI0032C22653
MRTLKIFIILVSLMMLLIQSSVIAFTNFSDELRSEIEEYIGESMEQSDIPGLSVVIVKEDETVYQQGFGYADVENHIPVNESTLFELGSTSKAFTGLAILQLEEQGLINLEDFVTEYIPWLSFDYEGQDEDITLKQFLYHTSGIPFQSIKEIPINDSEDALETTVRTLIGETLAFKPGEQFLYATINYDVLGLVIKEVTGVSYENYMKKELLEPLHLNDTYLFRAEEGSQLAVGYKPSLLRTVAYDAPMYRGNTPAGYLISNANDMAQWLKIQLGTASNTDGFKEVVETSHKPDRTVSPNLDGSSYAAGWAVFQNGSGEISHGGNNPNYASFITFRPIDGIGVAVLGNLNSSDIQFIGEGIMNLINGKELESMGTDFYKSMDNISSAVIFITIPMMLLVVWFLGIAIKQILIKKRKFEGNIARLFTSLVFFSIFIAGFSYCLYQIPNVLYWGLNWDFVNVWAPNSFTMAVLCIFTSGILFSLYYMLTLFFPKHDDKGMLVLIMLSIVSGFGNALIIFMVNEALNRGEGFQSGLFTYFAFGILLYVFGQKLVRTKLINIANHMVYQKRTELIDKLLGTSFQNIDAMEQGKIEASLNNDTETISDFSNIVITGATSLVTLICCFVYMGIISFYGLLASILFIFIAAALHFFFGRQANKLWEQTRDIQNVFFKFIRNLNDGFKELRLNREKRTDFKLDMQKSNQMYKEKRIQGDVKFANVNVVGELLFTFVIGGVAFMFPILFTDLKVDSLRSYVFVLLYMTGPVHGILGTIPNIFRVRISWNRINEISKELDAVHLKQNQSIFDLHEIDDKVVELQLREVEYSYKTNEGETFKVGPINTSFRSGEVTYITGGNGSGKSTLAKLATGLYEVERGEITINGIQVDSEKLGEKYSAIFSDFHLFEKLYGIQYEMKNKEINEYLDLMLLKEKVHIENGVLNTVKLSTGQRKRLALMISYLEDRPIYLFDEWAADQDPEFRELFYYSLLPELKKRGKCVIAITHDDRYFDTADKVIKMEMGKIVQSAQLHISESG